MKVIFFVRVAKSSINKLKSNGDKAHPCLKPDVILNQLEYIPFILTQADTEVYNDLTVNDHFIIYCPFVASERFLVENYDNADVNVVMYVLNFKCSLNTVRTEYVSKSMTVVVGGMLSGHQFPPHVFCS